MSIRYIEDPAFLARKRQVERERQAQVILKQQARRRANAERMARVANATAAMHLTRPAS